MKEYNLIQLYKIRRRLIKENKQDTELMEKVLDEISIREQAILENTSATGGPAVGGMGAVVSAQPSGLAGATIGTNWASGGGTVGSGDVSIPYNPSGANRVFQKIPAEMGSNHGPRTGKKSRKKKLDIKALKDVFAKRQNFTDNQGEVKKEPKVMSFDNFQKSDVNKIKK